MHLQPHSSFIIHHSWSFMIIHLRIFSFILFWSTPLCCICFSFGPHCRLVICSEVSNNLSPRRGLHISVVDQSMISPGSKPQHSSTLKKLRQPQHSRKKKIWRFSSGEPSARKHGPKDVSMSERAYMCICTHYMYIYIYYSRMSYYIISRI